MDIFGANPPSAADIDQMTETPQRGSHHRRAHSDTSFLFDDILLFDTSDLDLDLDLSDLDLPTPSGPQIAVDCSDDSSSGPTSHLPSPAPTAREAENSFSMDGSSSRFSEIDSMMGVDGMKKTMGAHNLSDPKRTKRMLLNRQSAARSKEIKDRYINELERKVQTLQTVTTTLSAQITILQRGTSGLTAENKELKMRLQAMEKQAQLRDALHETLKEEVQRLRIATGQIPAVNGRGLPHFSTHQQTFLHQFDSNQTQQLQQQQQQPLHAPQPSNNN